MLTASIVFVVLAIFIGIYMVINGRQGKPHYSKWLPLVHFAMVGIGAILVICSAFLTHSIQLWSNIAVAIVVSALGLTLSHVRLTNSKRTTVLILHSVIAVFCTLFLIYNTISA